MSDYPDQPMCPNCVTPWKCNGPHEFPETNVAPTEINPACCKTEGCGMAEKCGRSETPLTDKQVLRLAELIANSDLANGYEDSMKVIALGAERNRLRLERDKALDEIEALKILLKEKT